MAKNNNLTDFLKDVADAIREKTGSEDLINPQDFSTQIRSLNVPPIISTIVINQNLTNPAEIISGDINGEAIKAIRKNSHRYLCKYTAENTMTVCQLDDNNSNYYADGTAAILTGEEGDVFVKLPKFYYKAEETETDIWNISFAYGSNPGTGWKKWEGIDLIGAYEAYVKDEKAYSVSGVESSGRTSQLDFKNYSRNRGTGFTLNKLKHRNIINFLFYAQYGNTNSQAILGTGSTSNYKIIGATNSLGMNDTSVENKKSINFFGLEGLHGDKHEWLDNVINNKNVWSVTEDDGSVRTISAGTNSGWITKISIGEHLDITPVEVGDSSTAGLCDYYDTAFDNNLGIQIGGSATIDANAGFAYVASYASVGYAAAAIGSRLAFRGNIIKETDTTTFKSLIPIG